MNRRSLIATGFAATLVPVAARAQTPEATPMLPEQTPDTRARDLTDLLQWVRPVQLLAALETTPITNAKLVDGAAGAPRPLPWADYGDTDLANSLGGVLMVTNDAAVNDPDLAMIGAYIVYESAEIAYHELMRRFGDQTDLVGTMSAAGTNFMVLDSEGTSVNVGRIGYVLVIGMSGEMGAGSSVEGMVEHLIEVASGIADDRGRRRRG